MLSVLTLVPVWLARFPPGVDLPQHAAQLAVALGWGEQPLYREVFRFNPLAPHFIGFALTRLLAAVASIPVALKLVLSASLVALPLATRWLLRDQPYNPWWLLLTLPTGLGYAFYWGFVHYLIATPLAVAFVGLALRHTRQPAARGALAVAAASVLLAFTHLIAFAAAWGIAAALAGVALLGRWSPRRALAVLLPLAAAPPVAAVWYLLNRSAAADAGVGNLYRLGFHRVWELPARLVGMPPTATAAAIGLAFLLLPLATGGRFSRDPLRLVPLTCALGLYFLVPQDFFGTAFLYPRFAVLVLPFLLLALDAKPTGRPALAAALPLVVAGLWLATVDLGFLRYRDQMRDLGALLDRTEPGRRLLYLPLTSADPALPGPVYLHSGLWYQAVRRGIADFSFAEYFANPFHYAPGREPPLPHNFEWRPGVFRWHEHGGELFDCFLVHFRGDVGDRLLAGAPAPPRLELHSGDWWLYSLSSEEAVCSRPGT